jgi:hypothetical protein
MMDALGPVWACAGIAALVLLSVSLTLLYLARRILVIRDEIEVDDLPPDLDGLRVIFMTDIHAGPLFPKGPMGKLVELVNELEPDLILLGGDNVGGRVSGADVFYPEAARMEARFGKYGVLGNHDVWEGEGEARAGHEAAGITLLENSNVRVDAGAREIVVAGLEDLYTGVPEIGKAAEGIREGDVAILISHNPDAFAEQFEATPGLWDLAMAGHTHGGQISLFGFGIFVPSIHGQRYRTSWRVEHDVPVLVSNGVGTVGAPIRFQAPPEVHVITLHSKGLGTGKPLGSRWRWSR